jgi:hypothetical protein
MSATPSPLQRTTVYLPPVLWKQVRQVALDTGLSASAITEAALTAYLKRAKRGGR